MPHWMVVTLLVAGNLIVWPILIKGAVHEFKALSESDR